jgi:hypothetical protein
MNPSVSCRQFRGSLWALAGAAAAGKGGRLDESIRLFRVPIEPHRPQSVTCLIDERLVLTHKQQ